MAAADRAGLLAAAKDHAAIQERLRSQLSNKDRDIQVGATTGVLYCLRGISCAQCILVWLETMPH